MPSPHPSSSATIPISEEGRWPSEAHHREALSRPRAMKPVSSASDLPCQWSQHGKSAASCWSSRPGSTSIGRYPAKSERYSRRSEEHTSELQSLMRISYAVFCLKKKKTTKLQRHNKVQSIK